MADSGIPKPTGRRVRGYISDTIELSAGRALWTAVVYHEDYRDDAALAAAATTMETMWQAAPDGVAAVELVGPGVFGHRSGEVRTARELFEVSPTGIGWRATLEMMAGVVAALNAVTGSTVASNHGSLDPHRILIGYDGTVSIAGFGLPRLDLVDFLDDPTLTPVTESLRYTAPESLEGTAEDASTDLFILALIAVQLATGSPVYGETDAAKLLAMAADGEAAAAAEDRDLPPEVLPWLTALMNPWQEERPSDFASALDAIQTALAATEGDDLQAVMDQFAEIASRVEIDLPRGWKLPAAEVRALPVDPAEFRETLAALVHAASEQIAATDASFESLAEVEATLPSDGWGPNSTATRDEGLSHAALAREALAAAQAASARLAESTDIAVADALAVTIEESSARARGAAEEAARTLTAALDHRDTELQSMAVESARVEALAQINEAATSAAARLQTARASRDIVDPANPDHPSVVDAGQAVDASLETAEEAATALASLATQDDPLVAAESVPALLETLDASLQEAETGLHRWVAADTAESERLADEQRAATEARKALVTQLEDGTVSIGQLVHSAKQALQTARDAEAELSPGPVVEEAVRLAAAVTALAALAEGLISRQNNHARVVADTADASLDDLEVWVHTAAAEVDFATSEGRALPELIETFESARDQLAAVRAERLAAIDSSRERATAARRRMDTVREQLTGVPTTLDDLAAPEDHAVLTDLWTALISERTNAEGAIEAFDDISVAEDDVIDAAVLDSLDELATRAEDAMAAASDRLVRLRAQGTALVEQREAEAARLAQAAEEAEEARRTLLTLLDGRGVAPDLTGDEALDERLAPARAAVVDALDAFPTVPEPTPGDPVAEARNLQELVSSARAADEALQKTRLTYDTLSSDLVKLFEGLAEAVEVAEAAADGAAVASARARELLQSHHTDEPALADASKALAKLVAEVDSAAAEASTAAEDVGQAQSVRAARKSAATARKRAEHCAKLLQRTVSAAQALGERQMQLEIEREAALKDVRSSALARLAAAADELIPLRQALDSAVAAATETLEWSASAAAKAAWGDVEPRLDELSTTLESMPAPETVLEAAHDEASITSSMSAGLATIADIRETVRAAQESVEEAVRLADADADANVRLYEELHGRITHVPELIDTIRTQIEALDGGPDPALVAGLREQLGHAEAASEDIQTAIKSTEVASGDDARNQVVQAVTRGLARIDAARNTSAAIAVRASEQLAEAAAANEAERARIVDLATERTEAARQTFDAAKALHLELDSLRHEEDLNERIGTADQTMEGLDSSLATTLSHQSAVTESGNADLARASYEQLTRAVNALDEAAAEHRDRVAAVHADLATLQRARQVALADAVARLEIRLGEARTELAAWEAQRTRLADELVDAAARVQLADEVRQRVDAVLEETDTAVTSTQTELDTIPLELHTLDELDERLEAIEQARSYLSPLEDRYLSARDGLSSELARSEALSGIWSNAEEARARYDNFEARRKDLVSSFESASDSAPTTSASPAWADTRFQLEELQLTLAEVETSLTELVAATGPEEAQALLEVATASLDIAASVFDFAVPLVETNLAAASREAEELRQAEQRRHAAQAAITAATSDLPAPTTWDERLAAHDASVDGTAELLEAESILIHATASHDALTIWLEARNQLDSPRELPDSLEDLEALAAQLAADREALGIHAEAIGAALDTTADSITRAHANEVARKERAVAAGIALEAVHAAHAAWLAQLEGDTAALLDAAAGHAAVADVRDALTKLLAQARATEFPEVVERAADEAEAAVVHAEARMAEARALPIQQAVDALQSRLDAELASIEAARAQLAETVRTLQQLDAAWTQARAWAAEQLEALAESGRRLAPDATEDLDFRVQAMGLLDWPPMPEEPDQAALDQTTHLRLDTLVSAAELEIGTGVVQLTDAIARAEVAAQDAEAGRVAAIERIEAAKAALASRQAATRSMLEELETELGFPELVHAADALRALADTLLALEPPEGETDTQEAAENLASRTEAVADLPVSVEEAADALREAAAVTLEDRKAQRLRLAQSASTLEALRATATDAKTGLPEPVDEDVAAGRQAVLDIVARILETEVTRAPAGLDTDSLRSLSDDAELAIQMLEALDLQAAIDAVSAAHRAFTEAAEQQETERRETQDKASDLVSTALDTVDAALTTARDLIEGFPSDERVGAQRAAAIRSLGSAETHRSALADLAERLNEPLPMMDTVGIHFDGEGQLEGALEATAAVAEHRSAAEVELAGLAELQQAAPPQIARLQTAAERIAPALATLPELAEGQEDRSPEFNSQRDALLEDGRTAAERLAGSKRTAEARTEHDALFGAAQAMAALADATDAWVAEAHLANEAHIARQAAARAEAIAKGNERASLAASRADLAVEAVSAMLETAAELTSGMEPIPEVSEQLTALATANQVILGIADEARAAAGDAPSADDPIRRATMAVDAADRTEAVSARAAEAFGTIRELLEVEKALAEAEAERLAAERLVARDLAVAPIRKTHAALRKAVDRAREEHHEPSADDQAETSRQQLMTEIDRVSGIVETFEGSLALLMGAKVEDIDDFDRETAVAREAAVNAVDELQAAVAAHLQVAEAAGVRGEALKIEEARGRAWEANRIIQKIMNDLTLARDALPPLPEPLPSDISDAHDRLGEVERRLWRSGQRASEAREQAAAAETLAAARIAADAAEAAIGSPKRWESEIDQALDKLSTLLRGPGNTTVRQKEQRMRRLRRGKDEEAEDPRERLRRSRTPMAAPAREAAPVSPTERLLKRLRKGKAHGETGRERLKRLREERRAEASTPKPPQKTELPGQAVADQEDEYPSVADFDAFTQTLLGGETPTPAPESTPASRQRSRRRSELIDGLKTDGPTAETRIYPRGKPEPVSDEDATQAFSPERIRQLMREAEQEDDD